MRKKILIFGGECNTSTDGIIYEGCINLLNDTFGQCEFVYSSTGRVSRDLSLLSDEELKVNERFDAIIIPGSPWLWHLFHHSFKIKNLLKLKNLHKDTPLIFMGIGSCLPLGKYDLMYDQEHINAIQEIFKNSLTFVRDSLAKDILDNANVESFLFPCPSYYCYKTLPKQPQEEKHLISFFEPSHTFYSISHGDWQDKDKLDEYYNRLLEYQKKYNADVVCKEQGEVKYAQRIGLPTPRVLKDKYDTMNTMKSYTHMLSGRVHHGVPFFVSGFKELELIPIDSRHLTYEDFKNINSINLQTYGALYKLYIKKYVEG